MSSRREFHSSVKQFVEKYEEGYDYGFYEVVVGVEGYRVVATARYRQCTHPVHSLKHVGRVDVSESALRIFRACRDATCEPIGLRIVTTCRDINKSETRQVYLYLAGVDNKLAMQRYYSVAFVEVGLRV